MNFTSNKAYYQVCNFINSNDRYLLEIPLSAFEIAILYTLARYLDMKQKSCFLNQKKFAKECGMSDRHFRRSIKKLRQQKLVFIYTNGKHNYYELGEYFTDLNNN